MLLRSLPAHRLLPARRLGHARPRALATASGAAPPKTLRILGADYATDEWTNVTPAILSKLGAGLTASPGHPLTTLRALVESAFPRFAHAPAPPPLVTPAQNFDSLSFPADHPGRARSDTYYVNAGRLLRTHTSAHEVELFARGADAWTLTADVYRRDEVDARHSPVFHQTEGARVFGTDAASMKALAEENAALGASLAHARIVIEDVAHVSATNPAQAGHDPAHAALVAQNLKLHLNALMLTLFGPGAAGAGEPLRVRWIEASFPFTTPSFEVEVFFGGRWLEILGCGVVQQATLTNAGVPERISWAFGLGLERIAMVLFGIPDIRLFWSTDPRFRSQFAPGQVAQFKPYSRYPACFKDVSFWLPAAGLHDNDFCDLVRDVAGDLAENVELIDAFTNPKTGRTSRCYRINYRSMDRTVTNEEANHLHEQVLTRLKSDFAVEIR